MCRYPRGFGLVVVLALVTVTVTGPPGAAVNVLVGGPCRYTSAGAVVKAVTNSVGALSLKQTPQSGRPKASL